MPDTVIDTAIFYASLGGNHVLRSPFRSGFLAAFDRELGEQNIEYAAKREGGRLGPVRAEVLPAGAWAKWDRDRLAATGGSPEQYKHPCLIGDLAFQKTLLPQSD